MSQRTQEQEHILIPETVEATSLRSLVNFPFTSHPSVCLRSHQRPASVASLALVANGHCLFLSASKFHSWQETLLGPVRTTESITCPGVTARSGHPVKHGGGETQQDSDSALRRKNCYELTLCPECLWHFRDCLLWHRRHRWGSESHLEMTVSNMLRGQGI